jgi:hypothetical protein
MRCPLLSNMVPSMLPSMRPVTIAQHPFKQGRGKLLPFPREAFLVRLEVRHALSDLVTLRFGQTYRWQPARFYDGAGHGRFDDGARCGGFDANAFRKRHRFLDERIKISFPTGHFNSPHAQPTALVLPLLAPWSSGEQLRASLGELHIGAGFMQHQPAAFDRQIEAGKKFVRRSLQIEQKRPVD